MKLLVLGLVVIVPVSVMASECSELHQVCVKACVRDVVCSDDCHHKFIECYKAEARLLEAGERRGADEAKRAELEAFRSKQAADSQRLKISERAMNVTDKSYADKSPGVRSCWVDWQSCLDRTDKADELNACEVRRSSCLSIDRWRSAVAKKRLESGVSDKSESSSGSVMFGGVRK